MLIDVNDRRIHRIFVTRNSEYHLRRDRCVGVKDRETGSWRKGHYALFKRVVAAIRMVGDGSMSVQPAFPRAGESLLFEGDDGALTSPVISVKRPPREVVRRYPDTSPAAWQRTDPGYPPATGTDEL